MRGPRTGNTLRLVTTWALGALLLLTLPGLATAQQAGKSAEFKRVIGRVEVLSKGRTQWIPAVIGARLAEGRRYPGFLGRLGRAGASRYEHSGACRE